MRKLGSCCSCRSCWLGGSFIYFRNQSPRCGPGPLRWNSGDPALLEGGTLRGTLAGALCRGGDGADACCHLGNQARAGIALHSSTAVSEMDLARVTQSYSLRGRLPIEGIKFGKQIGILVEVLQIADRASRGSGTGYAVIGGESIGVATHVAQLQ